MEKLLDNTSDILARSTLHERLPIAIMKAEKSTLTLGLSSIVRLIRPGVARLLIEGRKAVVYHLLLNSKEIHEKPLQPLEFEIEDAGAIGILLASYPKWVIVRDLPAESDEVKM